MRSRSPKKVTNVQQMSKEFAKTPERSARQSPRAPPECGSNLSSTLQTFFWDFPRQPPENAPRIWPKSPKNFANILENSLRKSPRFPSNLHDLRQDSASISPECPQELAKVSHKIWRSTTSGNASNPQEFEEL